MELYLSWDQITASIGQSSGGRSSSSCNMVSQSVPVYVSEEGPWDNYTTGRNDENVQGVYQGEGSWSSGGFSGEDMAGPSTTVRQVCGNIRPDASRCIPAIISSTDMPSDNNFNIEWGRNGGR